MKTIIEKLIENQGIEFKDFFEKVIENYKRWEKVGETTDYGKVQAITEAILDIYKEEYQAFESEIIFNAAAE